MFTYNKKSVHKLQKYFKKEYDEDVTDEDAQLYLESLVSLFMLFKK